MSQVKVNTIVDASGGTTASINGYVPTMSNMAGRNRIINGAMMIDQRNAGASVTPSATAAFQFTVDRFAYNQSASSKFSYQQNAGSVTPPVGFSNYLGFTSQSAYSVSSGDYFYAVQRIEGNNCSDLAWGTASAATVTLSFWVRSSLTGTFGGSFTNSAGNRYYIFSYTINSANTWEQKSITIAGDTTGTWLTTNGTGIEVRWGLGSGSTYTGTAGSWSGTTYLQPTGSVNVVGTSGATFYITGVQLEAGSVATPFEHRQYGQELALCQRYFEKSYPIGSAPGASTTTGFVDGGSGNGNGMTVLIIRFQTAKRASPTMSGWTISGTSGQWDYSRSGASGSNTVYFDNASEFSTRVYANSGAVWAVGYVAGQWTASAEL